MDYPSQEARYESLAARIQSGDAAAEEEFVGLFQRRIRGFAIAHTHDWDLADELVQSVLWAVIRAVRDGKLQQPGQLPAFVLGTARNLLNDRLRTKSRERLEPLTDEMASTIPAAPSGDFERSHSARQAIATLEPHERWVLMLSLVEGLGPDEIAQRLKITPESVRKRKSRALRRLTEIMGASHNRAGRGYSTKRLT